MSRLNVFAYIYDDDTAKFVIKIFGIIFRFSLGLLASSSSTASRYLFLVLSHTFNHAIYTVVKTITRGFSFLFRLVLVFSRVFGEKIIILK